MKILFYRYHNICETDVIAALKEHGHAVTEQERFDDTDLHGTMISKNVVTRLSAVLMGGAYDCVFSVNFFPSVSEVCRICRIPYISWIVTCPVMELFSSSVGNDCNRIFTFDDAQRKEIEPYNPGHVFHLPLAAAVKRTQEALSACKDDSAYRADISFIGSLYTEKNAYRKAEGLDEHTKGYLDGLIDAQRLVYGADIMEGALTDDVIKVYCEAHPTFYRMPAPTFLTDRKTLAQLYMGAEMTVRERQEILSALSERFPVDLYTYEKPASLPRVHFKGTAESVKEMPVIFHASRINLNPHARAIRSGIALRVWDILAAGGFCMTSFQPELSLFFEEGVTIASYASTQELIEKCAYYLSHEEERAEIAHNALALVREHHTYEIRLSQMFEML